MSDMRLQEVYEEAEVAGVKISIPSRIQVRTLSELCVVWKGILHCDAGVR